MTNASTPVASWAAVHDAAHRLRLAADAGVPCSPVRDLIGEDPTAAYAVQALGIAHRLALGSRVTGRKVGLTSLAVQQQLGVDQPDFGVLLDSMAVPTGGAVAAGVLLQPKVEAELAFVLGEDILDPDITAADAGTAVEYASAAIEVVDSRIADWDITFTDTVADNGSSGLYVLAQDRLALATFDPVAIEMTMTINGAVVSTGTGAACLGNPLMALAWLARSAVRLGDPLRAGNVVLSGALGPMAAARPGDRVHAQLTSHGAPLSAVGVTFDR
jgi:2-keto-4-pentenoate hydratase